MKTMKRGAEIVRVKDSMVEIYLSQGYEYCPKSDWKKSQSGSLEAKASP